MKINLTPSIAKKLSLTISVLLFSACSNNTDDACEDVTIAAEQIQECQVLHRKIVNAKKDPFIRGELERRYQQDCIDIRYYRESQPAICDNKKEIQQAREDAIEGKPVE